MTTQLSRVLSPLVLRPPLTMNLYSPIVPNGEVWPGQACIIAQDCGNMEAETWKEIAEIQYPGILRFLAVMSGSETAKRFGVRITIDGEVVVEYHTPNDTTYPGHGISTDIGAIMGSTAVPTLLNLPFTTLKIEVLSTVALSAEQSLRYLLDFYLVKS